MYALLCSLEEYNSAVWSWRSSATLTLVPHLIFRCLVTEYAPERNQALLNIRCYHNYNISVIIVIVSIGIITIILAYPRFEP